MQPLNFHHLRYFWTAARLGSVSAAARELGVAQPTVSTQIKELEQTLGVTLLRREGRRIALTTAGEVARRHAEEVFREGRELVEAVRGVNTPPDRFHVGVVDRIPKPAAVKLLTPVLEALPRVKLVCREGPLDTLLGELALHQLDLVLSDVPASERLRVKAFSHPLGECGVVFLGVRRFARLSQGFPASLEGQPVLLPTRSATLRPALDAWFAMQHITPVVAGEFDDLALLSAFGGAGLGVVPVPTWLEGHLRREAGLGLLGRAEGVRERLFAITVERRVRHPAAVAVVAGASQRLAST